MGDHLKVTRELAVNDVYIPVKRKMTLKPDKVNAIAESMTDAGQKTPFQVHQDNGRLVLVECLHRLEACRALGEDRIKAILVQARRL